MQHFRSVGLRCAFDWRVLDGLLSPDEALAKLRDKGFTPITVDVVDIARDCIGRSHYRRGSRAYQAPSFFDCSSFVKWVFGQSGIWIPRRTVQQIRCGVDIADQSPQSGDLVFATGRINYYDDDPADGVGHVGLCTGVGTVIHAKNSQQHLVEVPLTEFCTADSIRGIRRLIEDPEQLAVFSTPAEREIESSEDIVWVLRQTFPRRQ